MGCSNGAREGLLAESLSARGNIDIRLWSGLGCSNGSRRGVLEESTCGRRNNEIWWILSNKLNVDISPSREGFWDKPRIIFVSQGGYLDKPFECTFFLSLDGRFGGHYLA